MASTHSFAMPALFEVRYNLASKSCDRDIPTVDQSLPVPPVRKGVGTRRHLARYAQT